MSSESILIVATAPALADALTTSVKLLLGRAVLRQAALEFPPRGYPPEARYQIVLGDGTDIGSWFDSVRSSGLPASIFLLPSRAAREEGAHLLYNEDLTKASHSTMLTDLLGWLNLRPSDAKAIRKLVPFVAAKIFHNLWSELWGISQDRPSLPLEDVEFQKKITVLENFCLAYGKCDWTSPIPAQDMDEKLSSYLGKIRYFCATPQAGAGSGIEALQDLCTSYKTLLVGELDDLSKATLRAEIRRLALALSPLVRPLRVEEPKFL